MTRPVFAITLGLAPFVAVAVRADTFVLTNGGTIEGTRQNATEKLPTTYVIRTANGGEVTLKRDQVREVRTTRLAESEYLKFRPQYPDTVDGQMRLAEWCRTNRLTEQRKVHLERVIELEPEHAKARQALGYSKDKETGEWRTKDEIFEGRGEVKDKAGRFRIPQQIEEIEQKRAHEKNVSEWFKKLKRWRGDLDRDDAKTDTALHAMQTINDPEATKALYTQLKSESVQSVRKIYVEALARIGTPECWRALTICSLDDNDGEIRQTCLDYLEKQTGTDAVPMYITKLKNKQSSNAIINRAADGLARMKDQSAVRPLIDHLVTWHDIDLPTTGGNMNSTFGNGPVAGTFSFGGNAPKQVRQEFRNENVLEALRSLTGQDFGYDLGTWRQWLLSRRKNPEAVDARRD